jgi:hypothetical protein
MLGGVELSYADLSHADYAMRFAETNALRLLV